MRRARAHRNAGGHGHSVAFASQVDGADEVRRAVREEVREGATAIKLVVTGGVLTPGVDATFTAFTPEEIGAGVDEAHSWGRGVAAHAIGGEGVALAVRAGVDSVEHYVQLTAAVAREMKERGTFRGPTLSAAFGMLEHPAEVPDYVLEKISSVIDDAERSQAVSLRAGVRHVCSTDAGTPFNPHGPRRSSSPAWRPGVCGRSTRWWPARRTEPSCCECPTSASCGPAPSPTSCSTTRILSTTSRP